ncbi:MAG TPA: radical SAM protein, partial [Burkholderiales bacterium]|nr:radical SAM protein [Burkholderiales bacterium]
VDMKYRTGFWRGRPVKTRMTELAAALSELGVWVRLHYVYPYPHVDEVIPLMAAGKILPYLDIPFQHASPRILKAMKRPAAAENTLARIRAWREICPELVIRSTFITGFPGETEDDFEQLMEFIEAAELDRVGCFTYSAVTGAAANALPDHVPEALKEERKARLMERQADISADRLERRIGQTMTVLIDDVTEEGAIGRSYADAPDIDGVVVIEEAEGLVSGDFATVRITDSGEHDLWGVSI